MKIMTHIKNNLKSIFAAVAMVVQMASVAEDVTWTAVTNQLNDIDPRLQLGVYIQNVTSNTISESVIGIVEEYVSPLIDTAIETSTNYTDYAVIKLAETNSVLSGGPYQHELPYLTNAIPYSVIIDAPQMEADKITDGTNTIDAAGNVWISESVSYWRNDYEWMGWFVKSVVVSPSGEEPLYTYRAIFTNESTEVVGVTYDSSEAPVEFDVRVEFDPETSEYIVHVTKETQNLTNYVGKLALTNDIPSAVSVVSPSTNATEGTAADAKATGMALYTGFTEWELSISTTTITVVWTEGSNGIGWYLWDTTAQNFISWVPKGNMQSTSLSWTEDEADYAPCSATRHLVTPTKTSQLTNDGTNGVPFALISDINDSRITDGTNTIDSAGNMYRVGYTNTVWIWRGDTDYGQPIWKEENDYYFWWLESEWEEPTSEFPNGQNATNLVFEIDDVFVSCYRDTLTVTNYVGRLALTNDAVSVVAPSTNATAGTAADAKAVGKALYTGFTEWEFEGIPNGVKVDFFGYSGNNVWSIQLSDGFEGIGSGTRDALSVTFSDTLLVHEYSVTATRHLVTPTKTSQLVNDSKFVVSNDYIIVGTNNTTISSSPNIIGSNIQMGSMAWYYSTIVFSQNVANNPATIYLTDDKSKRNTGLIVTNASFQSGYVVGDVVSIVNKAKYDNKCRVTGVVGNVIDVDTIPFTTIVNGQTDYDDYTVTSTNKPTFGIVSIGDNSFATGTGHKVYRVLDTVFGRDNSAIGDYALVGGRNNIGAYGAFAAGRDNIAIGQYSTAVGSHTEALADRAHAEGYYTMASGNSSHTEGMMTTANGVASHAEGTNTFTSANATFAHAEGQNTYVDARGAHVEGVGASGKDQSKYGAQAVASHVEGTRCFVVKDAIGAHAEGLETIASNTYEHAQGRYNLTHYQTNSFGYAGNTLHSIGKGVSAKARSNAVEVMQTGTVFVYGVGGYDGTNPTESGVKDLASVLNERHFTNVVVKTGMWTFSGVSGDMVIIQWEDPEWYIPLFANGQIYELYVNGSLEDTSLTCDYNNATPPTNLIVTATRPYHLGITLRPYTTTIASWNDNSDISIDIDKTTQSIVRECKLTLVADVDFSIVWDTTKFYKVQSSESIANGTTNIFSFTEFMPDKFIVTKQTLGGSGN